MYVWDIDGTYRGQWKDSNPHGEGIRTYPDGRVEEGIFENGKLKYAKKVTPPVTAEKSPPQKSQNHPVLYLQPLTRLSQHHLAVVLPFPRMGISSQIIT